jgi:uncharacterized protein DUF4232
MLRGAPRRVVLAGCLTAAVVAGCASSSAAATPARCHTGGLTVTLGRVDAGAGQRYAHLYLRNTTGRTCRTQGWPGLQLVRSSGAALPTRNTRAHTLPSRRVILAPRRRAVSVLHWTAIPVSGTGDAPSGACQPTPARLKVIPPDERHSRSVRWPDGPVCGGGAIDATAFALTR